MSSYIPRGKEEILFFPIDATKMHVVFNETIDGITSPAIVATVEFVEATKAVELSQVCYEYGDYEQKDRLLELLRETYCDIGSRWKTVHEKK